MPHAQTPVPPASKTAPASSTALRAPLLPRPPGPGLWQTLRLLPAFLTLRVDSLQWLRLKYGPLAMVRIGPERLVLLQDPDLITEVMVTRAGELHKDQVTQSLRIFLGEGLLTSEEPLWRRQRKLIAPQFKRTQLQQYAKTMTDLTHHHAADWADGRVVDVHGAMMRLTLDIVVATVIGSDLGGVGHEVSQALDDVMLAFDAEQRSIKRLFQRWLQPRIHPKMAAAIVVLNRVAQQMIDTARADLAAGTERHDLLTRLLLARDEDGAAMDDSQVRDETLTLLLAGHETTALALTWTMLFLADHPDVEVRLRDEVETVLAGRRAGMEDLGQLPYTRAVLLESMRLHPPAFVIGRQPLAPMQLGGFQIEVGDQLLLPQWSMHRDSRYFDEPLLWQPERWLDGLEERLPRGVYFPFGGGPRVCIGQHFAMMEAVLCLVALVQQVQLLRTQPGWPELVPSITLRPRGAWPMKVRRVAPPPE